MKKINNIFVKIADYVSWAMGTPVNILVWVVAVALWIYFGPEIAKSNFLPAWFTSNAFNFPLNTVTTLAELYIGFLVAAAANRVQKASDEINQQQLEHIQSTLRLEQKIIELEEKILEAIEKNV